MTQTPAPELANPRVLMRSILQRIATGPELSKDISFDEARAAMSAILEGQVDPVQAGVFLISLRMKRETDDETRGVLAAIRAVTEQLIVPVDEILDIADPYDGYNRSLPCAAFLPALLAACGVPAFSHGVERMGPKFGTSHRQVLAAAGLAVDLTVAEAAARLADPAVGWAYLDQRVFCPKLYALGPLRELIVKRPVLTTVEVLAGPLRGRLHSHFVTGYVHKPYPRIYALLARAAGYDSALLVRGIEGGVVPSLRQAGKCFYYHDRGPEQVRELDPSELGLIPPLLPAPLPAGLVQESADGDRVTAKVDTPAAAKATVAAGLKALAGEAGPVRDNLISAAALCLWHLRRTASLAAGAAAARAALDSGRALAHWQAGAQ